VCNPSVCSLSCPPLPSPHFEGLTKLVSQLSREGHWAKALELYEALDSIGVCPDTTITNAAISACDKGGQWEVALVVFDAMDRRGLPRWGTGSLIEVLLC